MPGASLALFADLGACHAKSQVLRFAFYPRPLGGGRHQGISQKSNRVSDFYPRPPGGGRHFIDCVAWRTTAISIHALRVEGDNMQIERRILIKIFLSTPSGWRATLLFLTLLHRKTISIHALRVEGDVFDLRGASGDPHFYPRPPGGGRQQKRTKFLSVFAQKGEEFASLRRGKRKFAGGVLKRTNFGF